jgi:hypothetical protein
LIFYIALTPDLQPFHKKNTLKCNIQKKGIFMSKLLRISDSTIAQLESLSKLIKDEHKEWDDTLAD